jgi:hypothetical protein
MLNRSMNINIPVKKVSNFSGDKHIDINQFDTFSTRVLIFMLV